MPRDIVNFPKGGGSEATVVTDGLVDYVVERIAFSVRKYQLKREVSLILYGPISNKTEDADKPKKTIQVVSFENLCRKARAVLHERSVTGALVARQESVGFYENMLADPLTSSSSKIKARENLDAIHKLSIAPQTTVLNQHVVDLEKLKLTLEQKKILLEDARASDS